MDVQPARSGQAFTIPEAPDHYLPLVEHCKVARVLAYSGGYARQVACERLSRTHGMIASFSRALLEDLRRSMSDAEFDAVLAAAIDQIYQASTEKTPAAPPARSP